MTHSLCLSALAVALAASAAWSQSQRIADLDPRAVGPLSSNPHRPLTDRAPGRRTDRHFVQVGGKAFFLATTCEFGTEVWVSDGSATGTRMLADIRPGNDSSDAEHFAALRVGGRDLCFFAADDGVHGAEPFVSDGTPGGTVALGDLRPGALSSGPQEFTLFAGRVWFVVGSPVNGASLWSTDGTPAGTRPETTVADEIQVPGHLLVNEVRNLMFFRARKNATGFELHKVDAAGVVSLVTDLRLGTLDGMAAAGIANLGSDTYFAGTDGQSGNELWRTDGTAAGTVLVSDFTPGSNGTFINLEDSAVLGSLLFHAGGTSATGTELMVTDGTAAGTRLVGDLLAGGSSSNPFGFTQLGTRVLFALETGSELLQVDALGVVSVAADVRPGVSNSNPEGIARFGTGVLFTAISSTLGREAFFSDGTTAGTVLLRDIASGVSSSQGVDDEPFFIDLGNGLGLFAAGDVRAASLDGRELWRTDGTVAGTQPVLDIEPAIETQSSAPEELRAAFGKQLWFSADGARGREPHVYDAVGGARMVIDLFPVSTDSDPLEFTPCCDRVFFSAAAPSVGRELVASDGTAAGTQVFDLLPGGASSDPTDLACCGNRLFFAAVMPGVGRELVMFEPRTGTTTVIDIELGVADSSPQDLMCCAGVVYFTAATVGSGRELWRSDGTTAGTFLVKDLVPGAGGPGITSMVCLRDPASGLERLYFAATVPGVGRELFASDGTDAGTGLLIDLRPGGTSSFPLNLAAANGRLWFRADDGVTGADPFVSDGTAAGTRKLIDIRTSSPTGNSFAGQFTACGDLVYFIADESCATAGCSGEELWVSDGTTAGTRVVADLVVGTDGSSPDELICIGDELWFVAETAATGRELWKTDGTIAGIVLAAEIVPGTLSGDPFGLTLVDGGLFYSAKDCTEDDELHGVLCPGASVEYIGSSCTSARIVTGPARLGGTLSVSVDGGELGQLAATCYGLVDPEPWHVPGLIDDGCRVHLFTPFILVSPAANLPALQSALPVPNDPALLCAKLGAQVVILDFGGPVRFTTAVQWSIGQ